MWWVSCVAPVSGGRVARVTVTGDQTMQCTVRAAAVSPPTAPHRRVSADRASVRAGGMQ